MEDSLEAVPGRSSFWYRDACVDWEEPFESLRVDVVRQAFVWHLEGGCEGRYERPDIVVLMSLMHDDVRVRRIDVLLDLVIRAHRAHGSPGSAGGFRADRSP